MLICIYYTHTQYKKKKNSKKKKNMIQLNFLFISNINRNSNVAIEYIHKKLSKIIHYYMVPEININI